MPERSNFARGYTIAIAAAVFLSTTAIFIRHLTQVYNLPPLVLAFWRDVFVAVTLLPALGLLKPRRLRAGRRHLGYLALYGLVLACFNIFWTLSVALNGAAVATVLAYSSAAFTALLGWWILKEHISLARLLAVAVCLGGCVLVSGALDPAAWVANPGGILVGLFTGLAYAGYSLMGRSAAQRGLSPWTTLLYTFSFASGYLLLVNLLPGGLLPGSAEQPADFFWLGRSWVGWATLFLLAAVPTVAGFGLLNLSLVYLPSSVAQLVITAEPVFTALFAYLLLGERLTAVQISGSLLILAGVVFLRIAEGKGQGTRALTEAEKEVFI